MLILNLFHLLFSCFVNRCQNSMVADNLTAVLLFPGEKTNGKNILANWVQTTSTEKPSSSNSGKGLEMIAKGSSFPTNGKAKTVSAAAGAPDVIDVGFLSDDELLSAVDELEKNLTATQQQMELKSNEDHQNVHDKTECISAGCDDDDLPIGDQILRVSSKMRELPESSLNKLEFPGKGIALGQKSSTTSSSVGQVLRRLPGIGLIEVRAAVAQGKVGDAEIRECKEAGKITAQRTNNAESDELGFGNHPVAFSQKLPENNMSCTSEDLNCFISKDTEGKNVNNRKSSNTSTDRSKQPRKNDDSGFHKAKTDIRFWLSDQSREVGEVVRVPNFTSVGNAKFRRVKEEQENALPSLKIPRQWEDKQDTRPAKKIRLDKELDFEIAAASGGHTSASETNRAENGACGKATNVDNGRERIVDKSRKTIVENGRGRNVDNSVTVADDSKGTKVDKGRTTNVVNRRERNVDNSCGKNVDNCRTIVDVSRAANAESSRAINAGNGRTDSLDHCSVVKTDCITLCSDDSDLDETQTIASVISRIKASVSIDDVASKRQDGISSSKGITSIEPLQVADTISSSVIQQNSPKHLDSRLPNHAPCPACGLLVDIAAINEHLDLCLR